MQSSLDYYHTSQKNVQSCFTDRWKFWVVLAGQVTKVVTGVDRDKSSQICLSVRGCMFFSQQGCGTPRATHWTFLDVAHRRTVCSACFLDPQELVQLTSLAQEHDIIKVVIKAIFVCWLPLWSFKCIQNSEVRIKFVFLQNQVTLGHQISPMQRNREPRVTNWRSMSKLTWVRRWTNGDLMVV